MDEEELRTILTQREPFGRETGIGLDDIMTIGTEGVIGGCIERILYVDAEACVLHEERIAEQHRPVAFGIVGLHLGQATVSLGKTALTGIKQEQMIPHLVHLSEIGVLS